MAHKFKIGDVVKKNRHNCCSAEGNHEYIVMKDSSSQGYGIGTDDSNFCHCEGDWELVTEAGTEIKKVTNTFMAIIDKVKLALKSEPQKTLISRGVLNADESLTADGRALLEHVLVQKYALDLKTAIDSVPVEANK